MSWADVGESRAFWRRLVVANNAADLDIGSGMKIANVISKKHLLMLIFEKLELNGEMKYGGAIVTAHV